MTDKQTEIEQLLDVIVQTKNKIYQAFNVKGEHKFFDIEDLCEAAYRVVSAEEAGDPDGEAFLLVALQGTTEDGRGSFEVFRIFETYNTSEEKMFLVDTQDGAVFFALVADKNLMSDSQFEAVKEHLTDLYDSQCD